MQRLFWIFVMLNISGCVVQPASESARTPSSLQVRVDAIVAPYLAGKDFMGVVAIQRAGEEALIRPYGWASIELAVRHDADNAFMIGSVSKQFTAAAILLLEEDGRLSTGDLVGAHLPDFAHGQAVTVLQLLNHTSGVADVYSLKSFGLTRGQGGPFDSIIMELGKLPLSHAPGTSFLYSNGGYSVLAAIIESVSGMDYGEFLEERLFGPLGMAHTSHGGDGPATVGRVPGYDPWGAALLSPADPVAEAYLKGSGSLWSTARDLLKWNRALHGGGVLQDRGYRKLIQDYGHGYGLGVSVFERFGRATIGHDGRVSGYASDVAHYVDENLTVVLLSNVQSVSRDWVRQEVVAAVFGEEVSARSPMVYGQAVAPLEEFSGRYRFGPGFEVRVENQGGRLMAAANEGGWSELVPLAKGMWFSRVLYATVRFERDADDQVDRLLWGAGDGAPVGERID